MVAASVLLLQITGNWITSFFKTSITLSCYLDLKGFCSQLNFILCILYYENPLAHPLSLLLIIIKGLKPLFAQM
jgi:hypothetical protein